MVSAPVVRSPGDQRFDEVVLIGKVMQQTAFAYSSFGGDPVKRQVGDPVAHNHRLRGVQHRVPQIRLRSFHKWKRYRPDGLQSTVRTVFLRSNGTSCESTIDSRRARPARAWD